MSDVVVFVLAAGAGSRFGELKQFAEISDGVRLVDVALARAFEVTSNVLLVLPNGVSWRGREVSLVVGGSSRLESVRRAIESVESSPEYVIIHDSAHPLAPPGLFVDLLDEVRAGADGAVPYLPLSDVVKSVDAESGVVTTVGRDGWGLAQVPMAFRWRALVEAHRDDSARSKAVEDSALVEAKGGAVASVPGSSWNVHVVTDEDLALARLIYRSFDQMGAAGGVKRQIRTT